MSDLVSQNTWWRGGFGRDATFISISRQLVHHIIDWRPWLFCSLAAVVLFLAAQAPWSYHFVAGKERGHHSDLPFLQGFRPPEVDDAGQRWRWSNQEAWIEIPGIGNRTVIFGMNIVSHRANRQPDAPPTQLTIQTGTTPPFDITLRRESARYLLLIPPEMLERGRMRMHLATEGWDAPGDRRTGLGVAIGEAVAIRQTQYQGMIIPEVALWIAWSVWLFPLWWALRILAFSQRPAMMLLLPLAIVVPLLSLLDAPRMGFGNGWVLQIALMSVVSACVCMWLIPSLLQRWDVMPPPHLLRWLLLLIVVSFVLKYGGRLYPDSMPGDLQLHINRYLKTVMHGQIYIPAQHRGLPFPFPNGLYLTLAPFELLGPSIRFWLQFMSGIFEATTVLLLFVLVARVSGQMGWGVVAGGIYALTAGGFMNNWFLFATQIAAQWFTVLLIVLVLWHWPRYESWQVGVGLVLVMCQVFLGHIGQFLNGGLVGVLLLALLWWRHTATHERAGVWSLFWIGMAASLFVILFYYSAFSELIREQVVGIATQGMNEVTGREPIPRAVSLHVLWEGGFITHFGLFPVLLAAVGVVVLTWDHRHNRSLLLPLLWLTFVVSGTQALLPFLTLNSITTRWLMFASWAIAVAGGYGLRSLWRRGRIARIISGAMAGYVCWITLDIWVAAMVLRQPPIEPF